MMKAYVLKGIGQLEYADVPMPKLQKGWALVRVWAAGICGSDIPRIFKTGTYHFPTIPGHEFAGEVVDVYDGQDKGWIGKRVGIFPLIPCKGCAACLNRQYEMCCNYDYLGSRRDGGFAEFVAVPVWNLVELPEKMGMEEAAMLEPASVALHAVRRLSIGTGDTVALYGLGTIGLIITQWLRIYGVEKVYAVGHNQGHGNAMKQTASEGFEYRNVDRNNRGSGQAIGEGQAMDSVQWILGHTGGDGVSIAIDCVGSAESVENCLNCVKPGGQVLLVGNPVGDIRIGQAAYWKILRKQIRLTGTWNSSFCHSTEDDWHRAMDACSKGELRLSGFITHRLGFELLHQGLDIARQHEEYHNKIMIRKIED